MESDRLVTVEREEIERARPQATHTIDLEHFVRLDDIDPIFYEKSYFLAPRYGTHAAKPYTLLLRAIRSPAAWVSVVSSFGRNRIWSPSGQRVRSSHFETLYFGDEVRNPKEIVSWLQGVEVEPREVAMAEQLISMLETEWDPTAYCR